MPHDATARRSAETGVIRCLRTRAFYSKPKSIALGTSRAGTLSRSKATSMRTSAIVIALSLLVGPFPGKSQQPLVGTIQGIVKDKSEKPLSYATLTATNLDSVEPGSNRQVTGADKDGTYQFVDVPPGRYSILVQESGYQDYKIALVTVHPGETVKMDEIKMSPARAH